MVRSNKIIFLLIALSIGILSCTTNEEEKKDIVLANVGSKQLLSSEVHFLFSSRPNISKEDSIRIVENYIEDWIKTQLMLELASLNLTDEQKDVSRQIKDYKNSLLIYKYQEQYITQKLDTSISNNEIEEFYNNNKDDFVLSENIVQGIFVKIPENAQDQDSLKKYFYSNVGSSIKNLETYCFNYAEKYEYFEYKWVPFQKYVKQLPITIPDEKTFLQTNRYIETADNNFKYYLYIKNFKTQGETSPKQYVASNIRNIIINKRKLKLVKNLENEVYEDALSRDYIKKNAND